VSAPNYKAIRVGIADISGDMSNDAVGVHAPKLQDMFAPEQHASALDPSTPVVVGSRGTGKSFWSGVLGQVETKNAAAKAYPFLRLEDVDVEFGYTGIGGENGIGVDALSQCVPPDATPDQAKAFWWGAILRAAERSSRGSNTRLSQLVKQALDWEERESVLGGHEKRLRNAGKVLLVVFDALDTVATTWPRRRLLTEALFEVVWATRAYECIKVKLFLRPDQIDDDALRFVELPKLRTGAVRLSWSGTDLYGLLFARLALTADTQAREAFASVLKANGMPMGDGEAVLTRRWPLSQDAVNQAAVMEVLAGPFMSDGPQGYKKGKTYDWPVKHLADAFNEVTPRSFLGLMIAAAKFGAPPPDRVITADGIRHGLREASKTRVDQLHQEFPWIKGVLAPLAGLLLPQQEKEVFAAWKATKTVSTLIRDAARQKYLPPFASKKAADEMMLFEAMERIGVMFRRKDNRIDMPDLFRVAARLLKKGGTTPL
jgi:hypothetical protein